MHIALVLLSFCAAFGYSEGVEILATAGETVILPCHISASDELPTVEWSKKGQAETIAFLYRQGCETHEMKNPLFWYRTNLLVSELKKGNISLRIANVKLSDAGNYNCRTVTNEPHQVNTMDLFVGAVSEPKLSLYKSADGGVALLCEANCWFPKPEITFLDEQGNDIAADDPNTVRNSTGCFHVTRSTTLQAHTSRVICRVHQPKINQTRNTEIYIPENCMKSCAWTFVTVAVTVVACAIMAIIAAKFYISHVLGHKLPVQSPDQRAAHMEEEEEEEEEEDGSLEIQVENHKNYMIELLSKIDALNRRDKDKIIRQLTDKQSELRPSSAPSRSTTDDIPSTTLRDVSNLGYLPLNQSPYNENCWLHPAAMIRNLAAYLRPNICNLAFQNKIQQPVP